MKSTHCAEIVPVVLEKHPDADALSIVKVKGYVYVGRTADWQGVTRGAYIPPDNVVDTRRPEFATYAEQAKDHLFRIKVRRLRGILSYGLMVPVPNDTVVGEDWTERLGVVHYEPPTEEDKRAGKIHLGGEEESPPSGLYLGVTKYDVDALQGYPEAFVTGEPVIVTEKLDGSNARYLWSEGRMWVKSRERWVKRTPNYDHLTVEWLVAKGMDAAKAAITAEKVLSRKPKVSGFWEVMEKTEGLEKFCRDNPGTIVFGEVYGNTATLKYGLKEVNRFAAFDVVQEGRWVDVQCARDLLCKAGIPQVPLLSAASYDFDTACALAEGPTTVEGAKPGTIREGCVVKPLQERYHNKAGRVILKVVGGGYSEKYR
jgi:RNA ligase (TIGR02306 family)